MKVKIRQGAFETNSSSQHSLVIMKPELSSTKKMKFFDNFKAGQQYTVWCDDEDSVFGRFPFRILNDFDSKFRYLLADKWSMAESDTEKESVYKEMKSLFEKEIGMECILMPDEYGDYGYIDKCEGGLSRALEAEGISLEDFLKDERFFIVIDGDEYCQWIDIRESGIADNSKIEKEYMIASDSHSFGEVEFKNGTYKVIEENTED